MEYKHANETRKYEIENKKILTARIPAETRFLSTQSLLSRKNFVFAKFKSYFFLHLRLFWLFFLADYCRVCCVGSSNCARSVEEVWSDSRFKNRVRVESTRSTGLVEKFIFSSILQPSKRGTTSKSRSTKKKGIKKLFLLDGKDG